MTTFIGRQAEIAEVTALLSRPNPAKLVTLTGPGGMGKTRLALQTAIGLSHLYRDGVWFVDLAPLSSPDLIPQTVVSALSVTETRGDTVEENLISYLRSKQILIVLDNCEHLIRVVAELAEKILRACARVQILATSRELLNIPGEVNFRVPPLSLPEDQEGVTQNVMGHEAVQLFIERARNIQPSLVLSDSNAGTIARICRQLDGMPLAIELAAARTNVLSLSQIESRLKDRFQLLTGGHTALARHQTLRATLEWSHDLLNEGEKFLFRRLSVFAGGWTLEAANYVCADQGSDVLDLLAQLVIKSLVVVERQPDTEVRYTMLKTILDYAFEQLQTAHEVEQLRACHFEYFCTTARQGESRLFADESSIDWAEAEIDNLRAALTWSLETGISNSTSDDRPGRGLELMAHIWPLWLSRGYLSEGSEWMKQLLDEHTSPTPARARALLLAGDFARYRGDYTGEAALIREALALARKLGDKKRIAWSLMEMGLVERDFQRYPEAISFLIESLAMFQELKENLWVCRTIFLLAETHMADENLEGAKPLWEQGLALCRKENDKWQIGWGLEGLGNVERLQGHLEQARKLYTESLNLKTSVMDKAGILHSLEAFAQLAAAEEQFHRAATLWGAAMQMRQTLNLLLIPSREQVYTSLISDARIRLGEDPFDAAWAEGQKMKMQEAVNYALDLPEG